MFLRVYMRLIYSILILFLLLAVGGYGVRAQAENEGAPPLYSIDEETENVGNGKILITKTHSRLKKRVLVDWVKLKGKVQLASSFHFGQATVIAMHEDSPLLPRGSHVTLNPGMSAFGWYGDKKKDMFLAFFSPEIRNLLTNHKGNTYSLLGAEQIEDLDAKGPVFVLEEILGLPLAHKKGITYGGKGHLRGKQLRCREQWLVVGGDDGELQKEKRYTFYGNFEGVRGELFKWSLNETTKLSWIDSEAGIGTFAFHDRDSDGQYETLECDVYDGEQIVEIFDVSDPWNIKYASKEKLLDRNLRMQQDQKALELLKKRFQEVKPAEAPLE